MTSSLDSNSIQTAFLSQIKNKLSDSTSLADEMAELLSISRDSAYRRIRGETVLSLDEVKKLYDRFGLSLDAIVSPNSNVVLIQHQAADYTYSLKEWLNSLIYNLELARSSQNLELIFAAKDIPVFQYFRNPELAEFKLFVWSKSIIKDPAYENKAYAPNFLPREILALAAKAWDLYASIPITEIWSDEVINGTLKQIEFYVECDYFENQNQAAALVEQLSQFIAQIKAEVTEGKKPGGGSMTLYCNEILIPDNTIFARMDSQRVVYINYNTMDLLTSYQNSFCEITENYMRNLIKNSTLISATAEKERNRFFGKIEDKILVHKK
jgi:plasmid maintenance system antidote protein VapI